MSQIIGFIGRRGHPAESPQKRGSLLYLPASKKGVFLSKPTRIPFLWECPPGNVVPVFYMEASHRRSRCLCLYYCLVLMSPVSAASWRHLFRYCYWVLPHSHKRCQPRGCPHFPAPSDACYIRKPEGRWV